MSDDNPECPFCAPHPWKQHVITIQADDPVEHMKAVMLSGGGTVGQFYCPEDGCNCKGPWSVAGPDHPNIITKEVSDDGSTVNTD